MYRFLIVIGVLWVASCQASVEEQSIEEQSAFPYLSEHQVDLTGDDNPETLRLTASGSTPETVAVEFTVRSGDSTLFAVSWEGSGYFTYDLPSERTSQIERYERIRTQLDTFFRPDAFILLDPAAPRFAPEANGEPIALISSALVQPRVTDSLLHAGADSATARLAAWDAAWGSGFIHSDAAGIWQGIARERPLTFQFFSGGEYTRQIAWSTDAQRFFSVWECC